MYIFYLTFSGKIVKLKIMVGDTLMTIEDLAHYLKVKRRTIYDWLKNKKVPASKVIGQWRFRRDKIDKWLKLDE